MSEENVTADQQEQKDETPENVSMEKYTELLTRVEDIESARQRATEESKDWKSKYRKVRDSVEDREKTEMESKNQFRELYEKEKEEKEKLKDRAAAAERSKMLTNLRYDVARTVPDAHDIEDVLGALALTVSDVDEETGKVNNSPNNTKSSGFNLFSKKETNPN